MTLLPDLVREKITDLRCLTKGKIKKEGCAVKLTNIPPQRLIIDLDKPGSPLGSDKKRCDYLLVTTDGQIGDLVAVLELKRGGLDTKEAVSQLKAGARAAEKLVPKVRAIRFRPVAASGSVRKHDRVELKKPGNQIAFHGRREAVRLLSCGGFLTNVL